MDSIKLAREIEERRKQAEIEAQELIEILKTGLPQIQSYEGQILGIHYRMKEKTSILEKIEFLGLKEKGKSDLEILKEIKDIIGITVETKTTKDYDEIFERINEVIKKAKGITFSNYVLHDKYIPSKTGFQAMLMQYSPEDGISYEIQIADTENIRIRNDTHEEFKEQKYSVIRNPEQYEKERKEEQNRIDMLLKTYTAFRSDLSAKMQEIADNMDDSEQEVNKWNYYNKILGLLIFSEEESGKDKIASKLYQRVLHVVGRYYVIKNRSDKKEMDETMEKTVEALYELSHIQIHVNDDALTTSDEKGKEIGE